MEKGGLLPIATPDRLLSTKTYGPRKAPTFVAIGVVVLGWLANEVSLAWIHERVPRDTAPLPDIWFSIFPEVKGMIRVTEYIMMLLAGSAFVVVLFHENAWLVARRVFFCIGLSYLFRAVCITILQVPVPSVNTYCAPKADGGGGFEVVMGRVVRTFWSLGIEQLRDRELCGDLIVSGHTVVIFTSLLAFKMYAPRRVQLVGHLYHLLAYVALIAILLSRKHYTIDVVLGYVVSTRIFIEYHSLAASYQDDAAWEREPLRFSFWSKIVPYFEADSPPPHLWHNSLRWPSDCPQRLRHKWMPLEEE